MSRNTFAFDKEFCMKVLNRVKDTNKNHKSMVSCCNVLSNDLHMVKKPKEFLSSIEKKYPNKHTRSNKVKFLSKVLRNLTSEEKKSLVADGADMSDEMVNATFNKEILEHFTMKMLTPEEKTSRQKENDEQKMTDLDFENFVPWREIANKIKEISPNLNPENIIENQMVVALIIFWSSDKCLRGDIAKTCFDQNANVYIDEECKTITVKSGNKTGRSHTITLLANGRKYAKMLLDARKKAGQQYLFCKANLEPPTDEWFLNRFADVMEKLFKKRRLTVSRLRQSLGIYLSEKDNGDLEYQRKIENRLDHTYAIHQQYYNRYKSLISKK